MEADKKTYSGIWRIAYPIIIGLVAQNIMLVIDTAFLGQLGAITLGAAAIGGLFFLCLVMLGTGFSVGVQIVIGRRNGENDFKQIGRVFFHALIIMLIIAFICFLLVKYMASGLLSSFIDSQAVLLESIRFLDIRKYGLFFSFLVLSFNALYIGTVKTTVVSLSTIVMAAVNIIMDYGLIFGNFGLPQMGIEGAALATNIAEAAAFIFYISYSAYQKTHKRYHLLSNKKMSKAISNKLLRISLPVMFQYFFSFSAWFVFFLIIEKKGEIPLAASNIARSIYMLLMIPVWGLSVSVNTLVSNTIGEGKADMVIPLVKKVVVIALLCSIAIIIIPIIGTETIVSLYTNEKEVINETIPLIYVVCGALLVFSAAMIFFSALSGTGKTMTALRIEIVCIFLYLITAYLIAVVFNGSTPVTWLSEIIYFMLIGLFSAIFLYRGKWKQLEI